MNNSQWSRMQSAIWSSILEGREFPILADIDETAKGVFLSFVSPKGDIVEQKGDTGPALPLVETIGRLTSQLRSHSKLQGTHLHLTVVKDAVYLEKPLEWDATKDGVFFMWGDKYRGMLLPFEIARIKADKVRILDRLCSYKAGVPSSLWRLPEGTVWALKCDSYN